MAIKTSGFNLIDLEKPNKDVESMFNIEGNMNIMQEKPRKKKVKFNFDHLFPRPKGTEKDMGMGNISDGKAFEGVI
jgi:hypothetical protein